MVAGCFGCRSWAGPFSQVAPTSIAVARTISDRTRSFPRSMWSLVSGSNCIASAGAGASVSSETCFRSLSANAHRPRSSSSQGLRRSSRRSFRGSDPRSHFVRRRGGSSGCMCRRAGPARDRRRLRRDVRSRIRASSRARVLGLPSPRAILTRPAPPVGGTAPPVGGTAEGGDEWVGAGVRAEAVMAQRAETRRGPGFRGVSAAPVGEGRTPRNEALL